MGFRPYAELARDRAVRRILLLGLVIRIPMWASAVVITLHVVTHLGRSYAEAGLVDMVLSLALAISSPWRGRRLDRVGLRAAVAPSLVVLTVCWSIAPWVGYWPLLALVAVAGLFAVPSFSIVRQVLIGAVPDNRRTAVLSVDSVFVEFSFMIGPVLGVLAVTYLPTPVALMVCQLTTVLGALVLWWDNPSIGTAADGDGAGGRNRITDWINPVVLALLVVTVTCSVVLTAADLGTVAALRFLHHTTSIGWVLALWGLGSAIGGIAYGAMRRHPPAAVMLVGLAGSTALVSVAPTRASFATLLVVSGLFCAPTITATVDELTRAVPARARGEALGWHGSALTLGGAMGAPLAGWAIDSGGWPAGFRLIGLASLAIALLGLVVRARRSAAERSRVNPEGGEDLAGGLGPVQRVEVQAGGTTRE